METAPLAQCTNCEVSYSDMQEGCIEYFIPWGPHFLCDKCHRLAIMQPLQINSQPLFEAPQWSSNEAIRE